MRINNLIESPVLFRSCRLPFILHVCYNPLATSCLFPQYCTFLFSLYGSLLSMLLSLKSTSTAWARSAWLAPLLALTFSPTYLSPLTQRPQPSFPAPRTVLWLISLRQTREAGSTLLVTSTVSPISAAPLLLLRMPPRPILPHTILPQIPSLLSHLPRQTAKYIRYSVTRLKKKCGQVAASPPQALPLQFGTLRPDHGALLHSEDYQEHNLVLIL